MAGDDSVRKRQSGSTATCKTPENEEKRRPESERSFQNSSNGETQWLSTGCISGLSSPLTLSTHGSASLLFHFCFSVSGKAEGGAPRVPAVPLEQLWVVWGAVLQSFPSGAVHCSACRDLKQ